LKVFLIRQWFDSNTGGYYSPIIEGCYELIPRPSKAGLPYRSLRARCTNSTLERYLPIDRVKWGSKSVAVSRLVTTGCPLVEKGVFCDESRFTTSLEPREGDYLVFIAGLAYYPRNFFTVRWRYIDIRKAFENSKRGLYIVGYFSVRKIIDVKSLGWDEAKLVDPRIDEYGVRTGYRVKPVFYIGGREARLLESPLKIANIAGGTASYIKLPGLKRFKPEYWRRMILKGRSGEHLLSYLESLP